MQQHLVYVLDINGKPLMPTRRFGKVRYLLKTGKAYAVCTKPFTIRLTYQTRTHFVQPVILGIDPGRTNIGIAAVRDDGTCLYLAKCETRNKDIPKLMAKRKVCRQASRRGERMARKRLAKRLGTTMKHVLQRKLPGYKDGLVTVKDIINTESRFHNRRRPSGWLTPTATQLLRTHVNVIQKVTKLLPISRIVLEINQFAFMAMDNPNIRRWEYQRGPLYGYGNVNHAVYEQQDGTCLLCRKKSIGNYHHIVPRSQNGSNTIDNIAGLCDHCHDLVHKSVTAKERLAAKKAGLNKKYGALSVLNQIIPKLLETLSDTYPDMVYVTNGHNTKTYRDDHHLTKDHDTDAYCIACSILEHQTVCHIPGTMFHIRHFRNHDRSIIHSQRERTYYDGKTPVAKNRRKRTEQTGMSLREWYLEQKRLYGRKQARQMQSRLTVRKSQRYYNDLYRFLPGTVFYYHGKQYVMTGQISNGTYFRAFGHGPQNFPANQLDIYPCHGLVYVA